MQNSSNFLSAKLKIEEICGVYRGQSMLYYKEFGNPDGKLVVFIHGGFTTCESYMKQYEILEAYHCVFVDLPGHGKSDYGKKYHFSFENAVDAVVELIDKLSPEEKVVLISHSYGGLTAKIIMSKIPEKIERAVIGSTNIQRTLLFRVYTSKLGCFYLWIQNRKRYKRDNISWRLVCDTQKDAWQQFQLTDAEKFSELPCLLLCAQYDIKTIQKSMHLWEKCLPNSQMLMIENVGHNYYFDAAEQVNLLLESFITGAKVS